MHYEHTAILDRDQPTVSVYRYRLVDSPGDRWLTMIAPGSDLSTAWQILISQYGQGRVLEVAEEPD